MAGYARVLEARSLATPPTRLEQLARDEVRPVRVWTAGNPGSPVAALERLAADEDDCVRWLALLNLALSARAVRQIGDEEESEFGTRYFFSRAWSSTTPTPQLTCARRCSISAPAQALALVTMPTAGSGRSGLGVIRRRSALRGTGHGIAQTSAPCPALDNRSGWLSLAVGFVGDQPECEFLGGKATSVLSTRRMSF
jgi:hypothetical protein